MIKFHLLFLKLKRKLCKYIMMIYKTKDDKKYLKLSGLLNLGYIMNLDKPRSFNEKLNWYKLNYRNDLMIKCADKNEVREYVKDKGLEHILVKKIALYNKVEDINIDVLPENFVAKITGDSGGVLICRDKKEFYNNALNKFSNLEKDYSIDNKEWHYSYIKNKILIEELIETKDGASPIDYKFFCFNSEPKFLFVATDRDTDVKFDFFDMNWNHLDVIQGHLQSNKKIEKPDKFEEMIQICRILSKDFPHVRVDLYYENGKIYFGELTFFHFAGLTPFYPRTYDFVFGDYFDIEKIN